MPIGPEQRIAEAPRVSSIGRKLESVITRQDFTGAYTAEQLAASIAAIQAAAAQAYAEVTAIVAARS
jgi:hypothetical protein